MGYRPLSWLSVSGRVLYEHVGNIIGVAPGTDPAATPLADPDQRERNVLFAIGGLNVSPPVAFLEGHALGAEFYVPVWQDLAGIQLKQRSSLMINWQWAL